MGQSDEAMERTYEDLRKARKKSGGMIIEGYNDNKKQELPQEPTDFDLSEFNDENLSIDANKGKPRREATTGSDIGFITGVINDWKGKGRSINELVDGIQKIAGVAQNSNVKFNEPKENDRVEEFDMAEYKEQRRKACQDNGYTLQNKDGSSKTVEDLLMGR